MVRTLSISSVDSRILTKEDRLPMSQGLKKFLSNYGYDVKPEMVSFTNYT